MNLSQFHFIRPEAFWLLLPAAAVLWSLLSRQDVLQTWKTVISPELLEHLVVEKEEQRQRLRPISLLAAGWLLGIVTVAGPTWQKEAAPFSEDQSALFLVVAATPEMLAQDIQPSRQQRAAHKIRDLLALRPGSRTGLIAYAASSHLVMPLTTDPAVIDFFATELGPEVMPPGGPGAVRDTLGAIGLAMQRLEASGVPGSVLLLADHVDPLLLPELEALHDRYGIDTHILAMAAGPGVVPPAGSPPAPALDAEAIAAAAGAMGGAWRAVTPDDADIRGLAPQIEQSIRAAPLQEGQRWREFGWFILPLFALMVLVYFRRGGAVAVKW